MNQIKEILRLLWVKNYSVWAAASSLGVSAGVVSKIRQRAEAQGLTWTMVSELCETELHARIYGRGSAASSERHEPDPVAIHQGLMSTGVTLELLHQEYLQAHPTGLRYTAFCDRYRRWKKKRNVTMRQPHRAGEKAFVDYSGKRPHYLDAKTGDRVDVELFVSTLGASNLTFAVATATQTIADFIRGNVLALEYFGGAPQMVVPDRLKSAVSESHPYEPTIQRTFLEFAEHYDTAVVPARPYKPRDKAKVENAVLIAQRWVLARLRHETFFSLESLNRRIAELVDELNERPMKGYGGLSRRELFNNVERAALRPLPDSRFSPCAWKKVRVQRDYHITLNHHHYSVPHAFAHEELEARTSQSSVELFYRGKRVASHPLSAQQGGHTTDEAHMPKHHQHYARQGEGLLRRAEKIGLHTEKMMRRLFEQSRVAMQGHRSGQGLVKLAETYGEKRTEAACRRALHFGAKDVRSIERMLASNLEGQPLMQEDEEANPVMHEHIRGADYFIH